MSTGNAPAALMTWPSRGTLKSASQAINRIVRLIGSPTSSGSRYDGWLPAMINAPSSGTFSTPWCSTENRTRNSGRAMSLMIEKSIGFGVGSEEWEEETRRQGDKETRRQVDKEFFPLVPLSPCLPFLHFPFPTTTPRRILTWSAEKNDCFLIDNLLVNMYDGGVWRRE